MRRIATEQLDLTIEIVVGQPPLQETIDGKEVELRYFFCGVITGEQSTGVYEEVRWISKSHLREYDFSAELAPVIEWLLER